MLERSRCSGADRTVEAGPAEPRGTAVHDLAAVDEGRVPRPGVLGLLKTPWFRPGDGCEGLRALPEQLEANDLVLSDPVGVVVAGRDLDSASPPDAAVID